MASGEARKRSTWRAFVLPNRSVSIWEFDARLRPHVLTTAKVRQDLRQQQPSWAGLLPAAGAFTTSWFDHDAPVWYHFFSPEARRIRACLELGSWEGRSLLFMANLFPRARLMCVDTFGSRAKTARERRFHANTRGIKSRLTVLKGTTFEHLSRLQTRRIEGFDLIFIDATHFYRHVLTDALLSWPLLRTGGFLVWDDYLWRRERYRQFTAKAAIDVFLAQYAGDYEIVFAGSQVCIRKLVSETRYFEDEALNSAAC